MLSKKNIPIAADVLSLYSHLFRCPICSTSINVVERKSLQCMNNHCFDISRHGYVNLLPIPTTTKYDKQLFAAREAISDSGFFKPIDMYISEQISESKSLNILDAGCGEGSRLSSIHENISLETNRDIIGVGLDISKEGVGIAAKNYPGFIWCVADLAKCPLSGNQFNYILNILSPANYSEFQRMLTNDGRIIKVIPDQEHLIELRSLLYKEPRKTADSSYKTMDLFRKYFELLSVQRLKYQLVLDHSLIKHLVHMTPLTWRVKAESLQNVLNLDSLTVTIDLSILIGKK